MDTYMTVVVAALVAIAALGVWWFGLRRAAQRTTAQARRQAAKVLDEAEREKEAKLREADLGAKEKLLQARGEFEKVSRKHRADLEALERRLSQRETVSRNVSMSWRPRTRPLRLANGPLPIARSI